MDAGDYLTIAAQGTTIARTTGNPKDGLYAGGAIAWVQGITGTPPQVVQVDATHYKLVLSRNQISLMRVWMDEQLRSALDKSKPAPGVALDLSPVIKPWALKYALPALFSALVAGYVGALIINKL